ncbi:MAG: peptidyl-prolyl cis-trans isomerase [Rhizobiaceae bacterium]
MLDTLRGAAKGWVAKILLSLLMISFLSWGVTDYMNGSNTGNSVMTAGNTSLSVNEYRLAYLRQLQLASSQIGQRITDEQAKLMGIDRQVNQQMSAGVVLDEQARIMSLGLSKARLAELTAEDPAFKTQGGTFSRSVFDQVLRNVGMRPEDYLKSRERIAVRQQIVEAVTDGLPVPGAFLSALALHDGENRTIDFVTIPVSAVPVVATVDEAALKAFYEERKESYKAPEYRKLNFVRLLPEDIADVKTIADADVQADYEKNKARFTTPETRVIEQLVFATKDAALAAKAKLAAGTSFEDLVLAEKKTMADATLGNLKKSDVTDAKIAEAAFALASGAVSDVVDGAFGPVLIRVSAITPEVVQTFDAVREQIRKELALNEAATLVLDVHDQYEDARAGGDTMAVAAEKLKLAVVSYEAIDQSGLAPDGKAVTALPEQQQLLSALFTAEEGAENAPLNAGATGFIWYEAGKITPARERPLEEVRERVVADWKTATVNKNLAAKAEEIRKAVEGGKTLDTVAAEMKLEKQTKRGVKRGAADAELSEEGIDAAFGGGNGHVAAVASATGDQQTVMKVTEVFEPADTSAGAIDANQKQALEDGLADDLLDQLVARLTEDYPVSFNQAAMTAAQRAR